MMLANLFNAFNSIMTEITTRYTAVVVNFMLEDPKTKFASFFCMMGYQCETTFYAQTRFCIT